MHSVQDDSARRFLSALALAILIVTPVALADDDPDYPHGEFDGDCSLCHDDEGWAPARISPEFDHAAQGFPLQQSHARAECRHCHATLEFQLAAPECVSCHEDVHRGELGIDCGRCHTPRNFIDRIRMVKNHVMTRFPLNGTHLTIDCEDCHVAGPMGSMQFVNTPWRCQDCHLDRYLATEDPNHQEAAFPRDCELCHSTRSWEPASFNHAIVAPGAACADCHIDEYIATSRPNHQNAGFPPECELCHSTRYWVPASFRDHDVQFFPIYSGRHRGEWDLCTDCHTSQGNFSQFDCLQCHDDPDDLADEHEEDAPGFVYDSDECYRCHPNGSAD